MSLRLTGAVLSVALVVSGSAASGSTAGARTDAPSGTGARTSSAAPGPSSIKHMPYRPTPAIEAIPATPDPAAIPKPNPLGNYNAYDLNAYQVIHFPRRQPGDPEANSEPGGSPEHGTCPPATCDNHEREFVRYWRNLMKPLMKPFGGSVHTYQFRSPGSSAFQAAGDTQNLMATIPGAVYPERSVIVSGHYDMTDSGPASAWDSSEGHATVFRIAKIMTDYWKKTGTRPKVSVKFTAWGAEEAGTYGSQAYIRDNLLNFPGLKVNGYFNLDPCAGAYPAYYRGNGVDRTPMVMQLGDPDNQLTPAKKKAFASFNTQARKIVGDVMNHLDDKLNDVPQAPEIFVSKEEAAAAGVPEQEKEIVTALGGLAAFSSDYANFEAIGIPILNLFPDYFGPHADGEPGRQDGLAILHTKNDNLKTLNGLTGVDQTGLTPSEGWYKGLEFCAHMHGWFMLQSNMGGAVARNKAPVAYFEPLRPKSTRNAGTQDPLVAGTPITFDAHGSYAFSRPRTLRKVPTRKLRFKWSFGDGTRGKGIKVRHAYKRPGAYVATLTVTRPGGKRDRMKVLIDVR